MTVAIHIGFAQETYTFIEPPFETLFRRVTLVKDDDQQSEQTFSVGIIITDAPNLLPATLFDNNVKDWDYRIGSPGQTFQTLQFSPHLQSISVDISLNDNPVFEGLEGFLLTTTVSREGMFPAFSLPRSGSATAFRSTTILIMDDECKSIQSSSQPTMM